MCRAVIGSLAHRVEDWQFWSTAQMYTALMERSGRGLAKRCAIGTVLGFAQAVIWETMLWVQRETGSDFAAKVENNLVDRYMSANTRGSPNKERLLYILQEIRYNSSAGTFRLLLYRLQKQPCRWYGYIHCREILLLWKSQWLRKRLRT